MNIDVIQKIELMKSKKISDEDRRIAEYILKNFKIHEKMNISHIANECDTSPTKVTRFSKKVGVNGFSELKLRLYDIASAVIIDEKLTNIRNSILEKKNNFVEEYKKIHRKSFDNQFEYTKVKSFKNIAEMIVSSRRVFIFAFNASYNVAKIFAQRLSWAGINLIIENDKIAIETYLNIITKNDLVFLITISGKNQIIESLSNSLKNNTKLIGIGDLSCGFKNNFDDFVNIQSNEIEFWNVNSIKTQLLIQALDIIYINFLISKVDN